MLGSVTLINVATSSLNAQDSLAMCKWVGHSNQSPKIPHARPSRATTQSAAFRPCTAVHTHVVKIGSIAQQRPRSFATVASALTISAAPRSVNHSLVVQASRAKLTPPSALASALRPSAVTWSKPVQTVALHALGFAPRLVTIP